MKVNGKEMDICPSNVTDLLNALNLKDDRVVVEVNQTIVLKEAYDNHSLEANDTVEIVSFVGGG